MSLILLSFLDCLDMPCDLGSIIPAGQVIVSLVAILGNIANIYRSIPCGIKNIKIFTGNCIYVWVI